MKDQMLDVALMSCLLSIFMVADCYKLFVIVVLRVRVRREVLVHWVTSLVRTHWFASRTVRCWLTWPSGRIGTSYSDRSLKT